MFSPALANRQRKLAAQAARQAGKPEGAAPDMPEDAPQSAAYQELLAKLHTDVQGLGQIVSQEAKIERKRELFPAYRPWLEGALQVEPGSQAPQDEIVITMLIWSLDIGEYELALQLGDHVMTHGLVLPERFNRSPQALVWSEISDAAIKEPGSVPLEVLVKARPGDEGAPDVRDSTRARMHRAIGEAYALAAENYDPQAETAAAGGEAALVAAAIAELKRALEIDDEVGSKGDLKKLESKAKKLADEAKKVGT